MDDVAFGLELDCVQLIWCVDKVSAPQDHTDLPGGIQFLKHYVIRGHLRCERVSKTCSKRLAAIT